MPGLLLGRRHSLAGSARDGAGVRRRRRQRRALRPRRAAGLRDASQHDQPVVACERLADARAGIQEQYKEYEQELSDSLAELDQAVNDFLDAIQVLGDEQLEKLLKGDPVALDGGDYIVLPGA